MSDEIDINAFSCTQFVTIYIDCATKIYVIYANWRYIVIQIMANNTTTTTFTGNSKIQDKCHCCYGHA